ARGQALYALQAHRAVLRGIPDPRQTADHGIQANGMSPDKPESSDLTHTTLSVLLLALLIASSFWVLSPFLMSMLWATIVSVAAWPYFLRLEAALGGGGKLGVVICHVTLLLVLFF